MSAPAALDDVLVVTVRKSFWASPEAEAFPHRVYAWVLWGHSTQLVNSLLVFVRGLAAALVRRRRIVLLGSVERTVPWFIRARELGLLRGARLIVTNQLHLSERQLEQVDRVIVYASAQAGGKAVFLPLPADGDFEAAGGSPVGSGAVFTGGGADRDFASVVEAVSGTDVALRIVTFSPQTLGLDPPAGVEVEWRMPVPEFLRRVAGSLFVVVALKDPASPHGQTTVVQALALGKAVVATRSPGVVDYVEDGREGFLVDAVDVDGYREAILRLARDPELRARCEAAARERRPSLTYAAFAERLRALCD